MTGTTAAGNVGMNPCAPYDESRRGSNEIALEYGPRQLVPGKSILHDDEAPGLILPG